MKGVLKFLVFLISVLLISSCADLRQAKIYYSKAEYCKAKKELKPLVSKDFPEAYYLMGMMITEGDLKGYKRQYGVELLKKAYRLGYWRAARELGFFFLNKNDKRRALVWFEKASQYGDAASERMALRIELSFENLTPEKLKMLTKKAKSDPYILDVIGDCYALKGRKSLAFVFYKKAYERGVVKSGIKLAKLYINDNQTSKATALLKDIYSKYGDNRAALLIGRIYEKKGRNIRLPYCPVTKFGNMKDFFRAKLMLRKLRNIDYLKASMWYKLAFPDIEAQYRYLRIKWIMSNNPCGDYFTILRFVKQGVKTALSDIKKLYYGGRCKLPYGSRSSNERNSLGIGAQLLSTATQKALNPASAYFEKGMQLLSYNKKRGIEYLKKACSYGSVSSEIELALLNEKENPEMSAAVLYYYATKLNIPRAVFALAKFYFGFGQDKEAMKWLVRAAKDMNYTPAKRYLAIYMLNHNEQKEALEYLSELEKEKYCFASILLGSVYEGYYGSVNINIDKAFYHYKIALTNRCNEAYFRLGRLYFFMGKMRKSLRFAKRYVELMKTQIKGFVLLFNIEKSMGNMKTAVKYMKIAINKEYLPTPGEVEAILPYVDENFLLKGKIRWVTYEVLARKLYKDNFDVSFCMAYEAAIRSVPGAAFTLFRLGVSVDTRKKGYFVIKVGKKPSVCAGFLKKNGLTVRHMINVLRQRILFYKTYDGYK